MNYLNSLLNQNQISSLQEVQNHGQLQIPSSTPHFDPTSFQDDFLEQMLSSVPSSAASYAWADDQPPSLLAPLEDQSTAVLASKMRQHQISNGAAKALMLQQQLLLSRSLAAGNGLSADAGLVPLPLTDQNGVEDVPSFKSTNTANDASVKALFNGLTGSVGQNPNQPPCFHHPQAQTFGAAASAPAAAVSQPSAAAVQPRQRVRARRGQATDPHSIAERIRRERIAERMKGLQELVPNANKTDKASMLDEIIDYVKFLQLQVKVLSMSRLGGAAGIAPLVGDTSSEGRNGDRTQMASPSNNDGMKMTENQVVKLMEEDMGSAMQYLQGKGLCLMPISLATAISTSTTSRPRNPFASSNSPPPNGEAGGPNSPNTSVLTVQSATMGGADLPHRDGTSVSKP